MTNQIFRRYAANTIKTNLISTRGTESDLLSALMAGLRGRGDSKSGASTMDTDLCYSVNTLTEKRLKNLHTRATRSHAQGETTMKNTAPRPITGPLRQRINKLAHRHGLDAETHLRAALLQRIQAERDAGAWADLVAGFQTLEGQGRIASLQAFIL